MLNELYGILEKIGYYFNLFFGESTKENYEPTGILDNLFRKSSRNAPNLGGLERRVDSLDSRPTKSSTDYSNLHSAFFDYGAF